MSQFSLSLLEISFSELNLAASFLDLTSDIINLELELLVSLLEVNFLLIEAVLQLLDLLIVTSLELGSVEDLLLSSLTLVSDELDKLLLIQSLKIASHYTKRNKSQRTN